MVHLNIYPAKIMAGAISGIMAVFVRDLLPLFVSVIIFELVDFVTGCIKSYVLAKRRKERFAFESVKAWRTIYKFVFILVGVALAELLDYTISPDTHLRLANYFTAFCCGVEFWSFLENAAIISDHPIFRWLRKYMKVKIEDQIGAPLPEEDEVVVVDDTPLGDPPPVCEGDYNEDYNDDYKGCEV